jgi:Tol biopolymer transport system component/predicted Ser/Thr protein kinase
MTLAPGTKLGPYELLAPIGAGGIGEVYRARDPRVGRDVAIKVSSEQFSDRFAREVHAVAALNHSNVCTLYDVGSNYLVMELVEGPTLADRIKQGPIPLEESLEIARQIADALEAAHEKGIVHRDLKPGNIKLRPDGTVKVLDFGLAKVEEAAAMSLETSPTLSVAQTAAGVLLGTAAYMSPEQARGKPVDKRADIWAFGVVLYEMLTGKQLFSGETVSDTLAAALKEEPDFEKVPAKVRPLLRSCLEKNPSRRLRDIGDAWRLLEHTAESARAKRPLIAWSTAILAMSIAATLGFLYFRGKPSAQTEVVRLHMAPSVNLGAGIFAVSPDGRKLAFTGVDAHGVSSLWIRSLDSLEARSLPGTGTLAPIFWSPDNRFIAFWSGTQLKKVDISGGSPLILCDTEGWFGGGSWNREGRIIFGPNYGTGLMQVLDRGGTVSLITRVSRERQEIAHSHPTFLRDGRHFVYWRRSKIPENDGVYIGSLDVKPEEQSLKRLMPATSSVAYAPLPQSDQGQLLFLRDRTLMSQPFNERHFELAGEAVAVADSVGSLERLGNFSASTNGVLVYRSGGSRHMQPTWFDRQGNVLGRVGDAGAYYGLTLSPDGSQAAISIQGTQLDIWLIDLARGDKKRFTYGKGLNSWPVWSLNGYHIIFASARYGEGSGYAFSIYRREASGAADEELLFKSPDNESNYPTSLSSDGRFLLCTKDKGIEGDLWVLPMEGDRKPMPFLNTDFSEFDGHFSPDMRWAAYVSDESGTNEVYVRDFSQVSNGASFVRRGVWPVSKGGGLGPRWKEDGKELYYFDLSGKIWAVEISTEAGFRAGTPKLLFEAPLAAMPGLSILSSLAMWDVSSDGKRFLAQVSAPEPSPTLFHYILNWTSLLKK